MTIAIQGRCTCHVIHETSDGRSYSDYMLGVNCGYCEAMMAEEQQADIDRLNREHPHGAGLAADDYRRDDLYDYYLPCKWEWKYEVRKAEEIALWGGEEPPF